MNPSTALHMNIHNRGKGLLLIFFSYLGFANENNDDKKGLKRLLLGL